MYGPCPVGIGFRACAPCTHPSPVTSAPSETPPVIVSAPSLARRRAGLRVAVRMATRSPWPTIFIVIGVVVRQLWVGRVTAGRAVRVGGVIALTSLALVSEVVRSPSGDAGSTSVRQAFAEVADAVGRARTSEMRTSRSSADREVGPAELDTVAVAPVVLRERRRFPRARRTTLLGLPVRGPVSSPFGTRVHPVTGRVRLHRGIDLAVPVGTPVVATARGRVLSVGPRGGYGLTVEVGHLGPGSPPTSTFYAHLSSLPTGLRAGLNVRRGSVIGFSGGVGLGAGVSTGPHVHYEVRTGGVAVDPVTVARVAWAPGLVRSRGPVRHEARQRRLRSNAGDRHGSPRLGIP